MKRQGFTIIELLVVIAIIGILSTILMVRLAGSRARASVATAKSDITLIANKIEVVRTQRGDDLYYSSGYAISASPTLAPRTVVVGDGAGACTPTIIQNCKGGGWNSYFNASDAVYGMRVDKTPSNDFTYTYMTNQGEPPSLIPKIGSTGYCIGTTVVSSTFSPAGAFYIMNGSTTEKPTGSTTITYANSATPCT